MAAGGHTAAAASSRTAPAVQTHHLCPTIGSCLLNERPAVHAGVRHLRGSSVCVKLDVLFHFIVSFFTKRSQTRSRHLEAAREP